MSEEELQALFNEASKGISMRHQIEAGKRQAMTSEEDQAEWRRSQQKAAWSDVRWTLGAAFITVMACVAVMLLTSCAAPDYCVDRNDLTLDGADNADHRCLEWRFR